MAPGGQELHCTSPTRFSSLSHNPAPTCNLCHLQPPFPQRVQAASLLCLPVIARFHSFGCSSISPHTHTHSTRVQAAQKEASAPPTPHTAQESFPCFAATRPWRPHGFTFLAFADSVSPGWSGELFDSGELMSHGTGGSLQGGGVARTDTSQDLLVGG